MPGGEFDMKKIGKGIALVCFGIGNTGAVNPAAAFVEVLTDGSVKVLAGAADIGQGSNTVLAQIAAETLGVNMEDVHIVTADTSMTPDGGATSASRQTYVSGNAVRLACKEILTVLSEVAERMLGIDKELLAFKNGKIYCQSYPKKMVEFKELVNRCRAEGRLLVGSGYFTPPFTPLDLENGQGAPFKAYSFGAQVAEVEVDILTGKVQVLRVWAAYDVGKAINPLGVEGQVEGGVIMGIGQALLEEVVIKNGVTITDSFSNYLLPTCLDAPETNVYIVESHEPTGPFGAKGVGEPALVPAPAAVANAIADAIGIYIDELPITPEKILAALNSKDNERGHEKMI